MPPLLRPTSSLVESDNVFGWKDAVIASEEALSSVIIAC